MKRYLWLLLLGLMGSAASAQSTAAFNGICFQGGVKATTSGLGSTNYLDGVIPACKVEVFLTGTTTHATIFKDAGGTVLGNPFTAAVLGSTAPGQWLFFAATGQGYDVVLSGGTPFAYVHPVTLTDLLVGGGSGPSGTCGPLAGDATSTDCGNGNFVGYTGVAPAFDSAYGDGNLINVGGINHGSNLAAGNNSLVGTGLGSHGDVIALGDFAANPISDTSDLVAIGDSPAEYASLNSAVCIGNGPCTNRQSSGYTLTGSAIVAIGESALSEIVGNTAMNNIIAIGDAAAVGLNAVSGTNQDLIIMGDGAGEDYTAAVHDVIAFGNGAGSIGGASNYTPSTFAPIDLVAIGQGAGTQNGGSDVVAIGQASAGRIATGSHDIVGVGNSDAVGAQIGSFPSTIFSMHDVVAVGDQSANRNRGSNIIAIGNASLGQTNCGTGFTGNTADENIAIGDHALAANGAGTHNVALGYFAGSNGWTACDPGAAGNSNLTGSNNTWIGDGSGPNTTTQLSNTIALGYNAAVTASNQTVIGSSSITQVYIKGTGDGCLSSSGGLITGSGVACGSGGGGSAFSAITGSTNTTATMVVGTGASLSFAGSGVLNASQINGITVTGTPATGNVLTATSTSAANWQAPAGGSSAFSALTGGTNTAAAMVVGAGASLNFTSSGTINASTLGGVALSGLCQTGGSGCPQLPVTKALVSHQFFTSYTSGTGAFTAAQPAFTDISGQATLAQLPNGTTNSVLLGYGAAGSGSPPVQITLGTNLSMSGTTLNATGGGGSGTVNSGTANHITYYPASSAAVSSDANLDDGATTANTLTYAGTGGITASAGPLASAPASGKAGIFSLASNTTNPTLTTGDFSLLGAPSASVTAYAWQVPTAVNGSAGILHVGAPTSSISQLSVSLVSLTADVAGLLPVANGGTGTATPGIVAGTNVTVTGTWPNQTVNATAGGGGDIITSPNSTLTVGGTSSNTTLDVAGAAGKILAGATPALTFTPALGVDGTSAGTLQLANGAAAFHTIWGSGATANNTINGFATVPTTGHLIDCTVVSTTCLLHDSSVVTANVVNASAPGVGIAHFAGSTQTVTSSLIVAADITGTTITGAKLVNNTITATQLATQYSKGSCTEAWGGSGTSFALTSGDDAISNNTCYNDSGVTRTITAVKCRSDVASNTTTVNPTFGSAGTGTTILSGALTCGSSLAYSSSGTVSNASWTTGSGINPVQGGTLTGTSVAVIVEYTF